MNVLSISQEINNTHQEVDGFLQLLDQPAFICDAHLRISRQNHQADLMLAGESILKVAGGRLQITGWINPTNLHSVIDDPTGGQAKRRPYRLVMYGNDVPYILKIAPLLTDGEVFPGLDQRFLLTIRPANQIDAVDTDMLQQAFGLTAKEAEVAGLLAEGHSVKQIARLLKVRESTVRTHTKSLLRKSEAHSQHSMVALFHSVGHKLL